VSRLAEYIPDRKIAMNILEVIDKYLPLLSFYIPGAPVETYGLKPFDDILNGDSINAFREQPLRIRDRSIFN
jgi:hypothetical protein